LKDKLECFIRLNSGGKPMDESHLEKVRDRLKGLNVETDPEYWDCEYDTNYIHPKSHKACRKCGANQEDMPDSRKTEVKK